MSFWIYLSVAAWQDGRHQAVSGRVFLFFFAHFLTSQVCQCVCGADLQEMPASLWYCGMVRETELGQLLGGALLGGAMMLLSWFSHGALGMGDGIFFLISGIYLGFWRNLLLLCTALFLCSGAGLCCIMRGRMTGRDCRKKKLPFLVFVLLPGILITAL